MSRPVYLDANIFIKAVEANDTEAELAWAMLQVIASGGLLSVTSELTLAEVLTKPLADEDHQLVEAYEGTLRSGAGLTVAPITRSILREAATIRSKSHEIRLPDAIHMATAIEHGCTALISNDRRLRDRNGLRVLSLTSMTADDLKSLTS